MSFEFLALLVLGSIAGGFINGLAGFGTALFALGFFLNIMTPVEAVAVVVLLSITAGLQGVWIVRHAILQNPRRLTRFLLPALFGVPIGVGSLIYIDAGTLKLIIAFILIAYGGYFTLRSNLPKIKRNTPLIDSTVGFAGGILGGMASLSGALPTMWCSMRDWPKAETRAVLQPYNVVVLFVTAGTLTWVGAFTQQILIYFLVALPTAMIAAQVGIYVFQRLSDDRFRRMLIGLTFLSGTLLLLRELVY